jgi:hypothetical protein
MAVGRLEAIVIRIRPARSTASQLPQSVDHLSLTPQQPFACHLSGQNRKFAERSMTSLRAMCRYIATRKLAVQPIPMIAAGIARHFNGHRRPMREPLH